MASNLDPVAEAQFDPDVRRRWREARRPIPDIRLCRKRMSSEDLLDPSLHDQRAIDALVVPGVLIGHRVISQGDEPGAARPGRWRRYRSL